MCIYKVFITAIILLTIDGISPLSISFAAENPLPPTTSDSHPATMPASSDRPNRAADRFSLSLHDAFKIANTKHPDITVAITNLEVAKARVISAGARPNPQIATQFGWGPAYTKTIAGNTQQVGINQLFEMGGKRGARLKYAKESLELAERQLADLRYDVRNLVRRAYAGAAAAEAYVDLIDDQRDVVERFVEIAESRTRAKAAAPGEELQAHLALDQFHALENTAYTNLRCACIRLDYLLGIPLEQDIDVDNNGLFKLAAEKTELVPGPNVPLPPLEALVDSAFHNRPDIKVAQQQATADQAALSLYKRQAIPDVLLGSGFAYSTYTHGPIDYPQQYGAYLNVNVDVPIFYRRQGEIAAGKGALAASRQTIDVTKVQVKRDVYLAYEQLLATRHNIGLYQQKLLPDARQVSLAAQKRYESRSSDIGDAIVGQRAYLDTMRGYFDTVVDYQTAWADLETAIGAPVIF